MKKLIYVKLLDDKNTKKTILWHAIIDTGTDKKIKNNKIYEINWFQYTKDEKDVPYNEEGHNFIKFHSTNKERENANIADKKDGGIQNVGPNDWCEDVQTNKAANILVSFSEDLVNSKKRKRKGDNAGEATRRRRTRRRKTRRFKKGKRKTSKKGKRKTSKKGKRKKGTQKYRKTNRLGRKRRKTRR